jgi:hypothetical protein
MKRRSFFQRLLGREPIVDASLLAIQVVVAEYAIPNLRTHLHQLIDDPHGARGEETAEQRQSFYRRIVGLLGQCEPYFDYACLEYVPGRHDAHDAFREWVTDIEASIAIEDTELGDEVDGMRRFTAEKRYIAVTILLVAGHGVDEGEVIDPDADAWTRVEVGDMLRAVNRIDWDRLEADAIYLVPGNDEDGFSEMDLADEDWAHLRPVT